MKDSKRNVKSSRASALLLFAACTFVSSLMTPGTYNKVSKIQGNADLISISLVASGGSHGFAKEFAALQRKSGGGNALISVSLIDGPPNRAYIILESGK